MQRGSLGKKTHLVMTNLKFQIRKFFEVDNILSDTLKNMNNLKQNSNLQNFVNGALYRSVEEKYAGKIVIPVFLYSDEFEINDPLSAHNKRHSICALYYSFPTLPNQYTAKLSNIFIAGAIKKVDISEHGIDKLIQHVVTSFQDIESNGIVIHTKMQEYHVYFSLMLVQGDNLGIHQMLKFSGSFAANFYCRFCTRTKDALRSDTVEYEDSLRNVKDYERDVQLKQSESGLTGKSIFNSLDSFHTIENYYADIMHDLYSSGVCLFGFTEVLNYCIYKKRFCTLDDINDRRKILNNYKLEQGLSRMPDIEGTFLKATKEKSVVLRMTASEMAVFSNFFCFIVGPFVPLDDPVWKFATILIKLLDIINLPSYSYQDIDLLKQLVTEHHTLYLSLFKQHLKPKHHFLLHYARIIENSGPLRKMSCFRHEARHRDFKQYFNCTSSRRNVCYTMCVKASLMFSYDVTNEVFSKLNCKGYFNLSKLANKDYYKTLVNKKMLNNQVEVLLSQSFNYRHKMYRTGNFLTVSIDSNIEIYQIVEIIKHKEEFYLIVSRWKIRSFSEHYQAYCIGDKCNEHYLLNITIFDGPPVALENVNDVLMLRRKLFVYNDFE
ncbi:uncharacterized protein LOC134203444 [Armigeres subalbatus]|uniref:uncharacterized protein LOC134203444 n=1 Tax=Armigeres subalbatus TaxID=124917 RepID=UPI002ED10B48